LLHDAPLIRERSYLSVVGEMGARQVRQRMHRLVADADDARPGYSQPAHEERHLGRVAGRDHEHRTAVAHTSASSTRATSTTRLMARSTTAVSGWRTIT